MIDGNRLVEALSLPSHDKRVLNLLKDLGLKRPVKDEDYNGVVLTMEDPSGKERFEIDFDEKAKTKKQKEGAYGNVDFYLNAISISPSDFISPPFGIQWSDSYEEVKAILGKKADYKNKYNDKIWILDDNEKRYILNINFDENQITSVALLPYNFDIKYRFIENED